ncbi:MAG: HAMP domain-containing histidine kinase [Bacteroidales bacterium]|nr:HAMP domain-containing histidine kinase [Bacteroidales bacterium]
MKKSISKKVEAISILSAFLIVALIFAQVDILNMNIKSQKVQYLSNAENALRQAVIDINYETYNHLLRTNPDLSNAIENSADVFSFLPDEDAHYDTRGLDWSPQSLADFFTIQKQLTTKRLRFDYLSIGFAAIDSIIRYQMGNYGIETNYVIGIYSEENETFFYITDDDYAQKLLDKECSHKLFAINTRGEVRVDKVMVYFPHLKRSIWIHDIAYHFYLVFILLLVILFFFSTIHILKKQEEISILKYNMVNNMTHEIKTPISTISLACQALQDNNFQKDQTLVETYINVISEENDKIKQLVEEVLNTVRLNRLNKIPNPEPFSLHEVVETTAKMHKLSAEAKNAKIILNLMAENDTVVGDHVHVGNAISNLIDNALKYSKGNPEVIISTENRSDNIVVQVQDNGIGIPRKELPHIFDEFYRVDTGNLHNVKGHGLGLHYVKTVMTYHKGKVSVKSDTKTGSTFTLTLPIQQNSANMGGGRKR